MTVAELIETLEKIENKEMLVRVRIGDLESLELDVTIFVDSILGQVLNIEDYK